MTDHIFRDDFELAPVAPIAPEELEEEAPAVASNATAEREAKARRDAALDPLARTHEPRTFAGDPGDIETSVTAGSAASGTTAPGVRDWASMGGPPAPSAKQHADDDPWLADSFGESAELSDGASGWLRD